jgi:hypothetical protein
MGWFKKILIMENIDNTIIPELHIQPISSPPKSNIFKYLFFISIFLFLSLGIFYYINLTKNSQIVIFNKEEETQSQEKNNNSTSWSKPISTDNVIPIVKDEILYTYSLTNKKLQATEYNATWGSGASGFGSDDPLLSPDGKLIVFINKGDNDCLYILPAGSQKALKITEYPVRYINSWSSDSSKILFYSDPDNLAIRKSSSGMGGPSLNTWEVDETFIKVSFPGFHSFNINNGVDTYIPQLLTADKFIDSNRILVEINQDEDNKKQRLVIFNVDTFVADYSTVNYEIKDFVLQKSFSSDGNFWAINTDDGNTENGNKIIFTKFPLKTGDLVYSGYWSEVQNPILNHDGKYLAFLKKGEEVSAGINSYNTIIWDSSSKENIKELTGSPQYWINNILIIYISESGNNPSSLSSISLFNVDTQETDNFSVK